MQTKIEKEVRFLKIYALTVTLLGAVFLLSAFAWQNGVRKFEEIDVQRINVREKDGRLRLVIANTERQHPGQVDGRPIPRTEPRAAGLIFFNERGDEMGGLVLSGGEGKGQYGSLTFDKYRGDQTIAFQHLENDKGLYFAGLSFNDENSTTPERNERMEQINRLTDKTARAAAIREMKENGGFLVNRLALGKGRDRFALISLSDAKGRERLSISVAADGNPKIEFLDESGKVVYRLPEKSPTGSEPKR